MSNIWNRIKAYLCFGGEDEQQSALVIGGPFDFKRVDVHLAGLSEQEQTMINNRPVPVTYPINNDGSSATVRLSNSLKSVTTHAMAGVGAKGSGYLALANASTPIMQLTRTEVNETPHEMKELLPRGTGGHETNSSFTGKGSVETATAGCEEEE